MAYNNVPVGTSSGPLTASGAVLARDGAMLGLLCTSSTSLVVRCWDNATAASGTKLFDSLTVSAGTWYPFPVTFENGLYLQVVSGSGSVSLSIV